MSMVLIDLNHFVSNNFIFLFFVCVVFVKKRVVCLWTFM